MHALPPIDTNQAPDAALGQALEQPLLAVESCLNLLGEALLRRDSQAIELHASALHQALAEAIAMFSEAARAGQVPPACATAWSRPAAAWPLSASPWPGLPRPWTAPSMC